MTVLQGSARQADEAIQEVVGRQSNQLGLLMHLVHWRPSFPLTHTSHSFWHKLHASLAYSQLITQQELHLIKRLAGQLSGAFPLPFTYLLVSTRSERAAYSRSQLCPCRFFCNKPTPLQLNPGELGEPHVVDCSKTAS